MTKLLKKFVVWGNPGQISFSGFTAADARMKALSLADGVRVADAEDGQGYVFASNVKRRDQTITLTFIPIDSSTPGSLATAKANIKLPDPGAVVTLSGYDNSLLDGDWNYVGGGVVNIPEDDSQPVTITGCQLRRAAASGAQPVVQSVLT